MNREINYEPTPLSTFDYPSRQGDPWLFEEPFVNRKIKVGDVCYVISFNFSWHDYFLSRGKVIKIVTLPAENLRGVDRAKRGDYTLRALSPVAPIDEAPMEYYNTPSVKKSARIYETFMAHEFQTKETTFCFIAKDKSDVLLIRRWIERGLTRDRQKAKRKFDKRLRWLESLTDKKEVSNDEG